MGAERTALVLSGGGCRPSQDAMIQALKQLPGVAGVKANLIPDHLLVDHAAEAVTGDDLAALINTLMETGGPCNAIVMRSCITAGTPTFAPSALGVTVRPPDVSRAR